MITDHMVRQMLTNVCIQLMCLYQVSLQGQWERKLLHDLMSDYNTLERPVRNESEPIIVSLGLTLLQIIDLDEKNQILITRTWLSMEWTDDNLKWDPAEYGNISALRIPPHGIWKPDIVMYNSADEQFDGTYQTDVVVRKNGGCTYISPGIVKSTCRMDMTWFPFDEQKCALRELDYRWCTNLQLNTDQGGDISSYIPNSEWILKCTERNGGVDKYYGVPGVRNAIYYACCPDPYLDVTFVIHIQRRTLYYLINLMVPFVIITPLAVIGFILPPDSRERLTLGVAILISMTVFLIHVAAIIPVSSEVPLLGDSTTPVCQFYYWMYVENLKCFGFICAYSAVYFNSIMFTVAVSIVSTIVSLIFHFRSPGTHEMSRWVRIVFLEWLPWFLRMNRPGHPIIIKEMSLTDDRLRGQTHDLELKEPYDTEGISASRREQSIILNEIRHVKNKIQKDDEASGTSNEWKFVAMVIDRLCLIVFTLFTIIATIAVFALAPQIFVQ